MFGNTLANLDNGELRFFGTVMSHCQPGICCCWMFVRGNAAGLHGGDILRLDNVRGICKAHAEWHRPSHALPGSNKL